MKIRTDFVTNSSSSSFLVARKGPLTDKMKDAIVKFTEEVLLGDVQTKTSVRRLYRDSTADPFFSMIYGDDPEMQELLAWERRENNKKLKKVQDAFKKDWIVSGSVLDFELEEEGVTSTYMELLNRLQEADPEHFQVIWHDLDKSFDF